MDWYRGMSMAIDYMEENMTDTIELTKCAQYVRCSTWEFQRIFSFITDTTVSEYIRKRRLSLAAEEVLHGTGKILDIAVRYGYESHAAFSRAFSQRFGLSPSDLRKEKNTVALYPRISFQILIESWYRKMSKFSERGYVVKENGPVYFTRDMAKTLAWFEETLGWYGDIAEKDAEGAGIYGCVYDVPQEIAIAHIAPFTGIHMFSGEPSQGLVAFVQVQGIERLHQYVKANGWDNITEIQKQPWGSYCTVTTIDGSQIRFFE